MSRQTTGLDRFPTLAELERKHLERTGKPLPLDSAMPPVAAARLSRAATISAERVEAQSAVGDAYGNRLGDTLHLTLPFPPRTKKNNTTLGIRQKKAYRVFKLRVMRVIEPMHGRLRLPLPDQPYNIRVIYHVDRRGESADKVGLDQGLYDALENSGVVTNDWFFRTDDGSRVVFGSEKPRVEIVITPLTSTL
jgi:hypothetical protein